MSKPAEVLEFRSGQVYLGVNRATCSIYGQSRLAHFDSNLLIKLIEKLNFELICDTTFVLLLRPLKSSMTFSFHC